VNLAGLEALPSFALLGPGFAGPHYTLLRNLGPARPGQPRLVFADFEASGRAPRVFSAGAVSNCALDFPAAPPALRVRLVAPAYASKVARIRADIARGDVYQVCLTERADLTGIDGASLMALMAHGRPRFGAWVRLPGGPEFVSASPELFFETRGRDIHSQPMKGTAPAHGAAGLRASLKDRAELAMITDLLRNDLARVCVSRSVRVLHARRLLRLPYAVQAVSDITGRLAPGRGPLEALAALHPGGSVTGAPKAAALERIRRLERRPRGAYCGALGFWKGPRAVFSILIRTAQRRGGGWTYGVGGGIVYGSDPGRERAELDVKMGALAWPTA
jgi:para-aminobenzoate synthetase/4-amino-4-deoxychorismate lyase